MRPVRKGSSPIDGDGDGDGDGDFNQYEDAKPELVSRLGLYCSYCERKIPTLLAVEHIEPKAGDFGQSHLEKRWSNFLLACTNCNSCKGSKEVNFKRLLFPDRDNSYYSYLYRQDGTIALNPALSVRQQVMARNTLRLVGLDKPLQIYKDSNDEQVALDRSAQRMQAWANAQSAEEAIQQQPHNRLLKDMAVKLAVAEGFFSIWMSIFSTNNNMKKLLIKAFKGTEDSGCFDMATGNSITPAPNPDNLAHGGKV
ncbi:MAG: hypothetical protein ACI88H_000210 [Cocleimonas sp.]|jgi:uncharacterized protein (TIGR02646 family)